MWLRLKMMCYEPRWLIDWVSDAGDQHTSTAYKYIGAADTHIQLRRDGLGQTEELGSCIFLLEGGKIGGGGSDGLIFVFSWGSLRSEVCMGAAWGAVLLG